MDLRGTCCCSVLGSCKDGNEPYDSIGEEHRIISSESSIPCRRNVHSQLLHGQQISPHAVIHPKLKSLPDYLRSLKNMFAGFMVLILRLVFVQITCGLNGKIHGLFRHVTCWITLRYIRAFFFSQLLLQAKNFSTTTILNPCYSEYMLPISVGVKKKPFSVYILKSDALIYFYSDFNTF